MMYGNGPPSALCCSGMSTYILHEEIAIGHDSEDMKKNKEEVERTLPVGGKGFLSRDGISVATVQPSSVHIRMQGLGR
jgi:hypothetical protein